MLLFTTRKLAASNNVCKLYYQLQLVKLTGRCNKCHFVFEHCMGTYTANQKYQQGRQIPISRQSSKLRFEITSHFGWIGLGLILN